ncbi:DUF5366 family protein [Bacillus alkalicellulosilyticus]|uniref:DUF5366 family protein n=1 Tax=Alkalihalobacterium alkalicellulosilyticum TaxID=1912214 RepID=UPI0009976C8E|nr:DUF5366 family protein [Bacillus alkalicellulosilyticus]
MNNTYLTSHFPLFSIFLFSTSLSLYTESYIISQLIYFGIYDGMMDFFSENGIKLTLVFLLVLLFFMVFSALKLINDTNIQLSLLFFSKDVEGSDLQKIRSGSWIFLVASGLSLLFTNHIIAIVALFVGAVIIYFFYLLYRISESLSIAGMIGMIFFHILFWVTFTLAVMYALLTLYNGFIASLPI